MNLHFVLLVGDIGHTIRVTYNPDPRPASGAFLLQPPTRFVLFVLFTTFYDRQALVLAGMTGRISFPNTQKSVLYLAVLGFCVL